MHTWLGMLAPALPHVDNGNARPALAASTLWPWQGRQAPGQLTWEGLAASSMAARRSQDAASRRMPVLQLHMPWHCCSVMMRSQHVPPLPIMLHTLLPIMLHTLLPIVLHTLLPSILLHTVGRLPSLPLLGAAGRSVVRPAS